MYLFFLPLTLTPNPNSLAPAPSAPALVVTMPCITMLSTDTTVQREEEKCYLMLYSRPLLVAPTE